MCTIGALLSGGLASVSNDAALCSLVWSGMCGLAAVCTGAIRVVFIDETASSAKGALHKRSMAYSLHLFLVRPGARVAVGLVGRVCYILICIP